VAQLARGKARLASIPEVINVTGGMMKVQEFCLPSVVVAATMVVASGCSGGTLTSAPPQPEKPNITVAAVPAVDSVGLYVAYDRGYFRQQGLNVKIIRAVSSETAISGQLAGKIDISGGNYVSYLQAEISAARLHILAEGSIAGPGGQVLVTRAGSPIRSISGLIGRTIGVNAPDNIGTLLIRALLQAHGIRSAEVHLVTDPKGFPAMPADLAAGDFDAAFLPEPFAAIAGEHYGDPVLADLDQGASHNFPIQGYVATQAWVSKYPRTAAAFIRALEQGQGIADTDHGAVEKAMQQFAALTPEQTAVMAVPLYPTGPVNRTRIQRVADAMLQNDIASRRFSVGIMMGPVP
jgi:NitT/TauT family transport system substrate-binding protein